MNSTLETMMSKLVTGFILSLLSVICVEETSVSTGSCFSRRFDNGNCIGLLAERLTQAECCQRNGFYLNRQLTQQEYLTYHLLLEIGTPNCVNACKEEVKPTCHGYICPEGHTCKVVNKEPRCICRPKCSVSDYMSGPVCTSNLRRFQHLCHMKQARCASPIEGFTIVPCPEEGLHCSETSLLPETPPAQLSSTESSFLDPDLIDLMQSDNEIKDSFRSPWSSQNSVDLVKRGIHMMERHRPDDLEQFQRFINSRFRKSGRQINSNKRLTPSRNERPYFLSPSLLLSSSSSRSPSTSGSTTEPESTTNQNATTLKELQCSTNEYCMLRQYDGLPMCERWDSEDWKNLQDCENSTLDEPICGTDNVTYSSSCQLKFSGLRRQLEIRIAYKGPCRANVGCADVTCPRLTMTCRPHHSTGQPVCLDCSKLPSDCNASFKSRRTSRQRQQLQQQQVARRTVEDNRFGDPIWTAPLQTHGWPVVCGSNGKTYRNTCFLHIMNCLSGKFVEMKKPQFCTEIIPSQ